MHFKAKLNGFSNFYHEFVERGAIDVTPGQLGYRGDIQAPFISLDNDIKQLARHRVPVTGAATGAGAGMFPFGGSRCAYCEGRPGPGPSARLPLQYGL